MPEPSAASAAYLQTLREGLPLYDTLQDEVVRATEGLTISHLLDLGAGTGETSRRLLLAHPGATVMAIDSQPELLQIAREQLGGRAELRLSELFEPLPHGPYDLIVSALALHTLRPADRSRLLTRAARVLRPQGRIVIADAITPGIDRGGARLDDRAPDRLETLAARMVEAGFATRTRWSTDDLAVLVGTRA